MSEHNVTRLEVSFWGSVIMANVVENRWIAGLFLVIMLGSLIAGVVVSKHI